MPPPPYHGRDYLIHLQLHSQGSCHYMVEFGHVSPAPWIKRHYITCHVRRWGSCDRSQGKISCHITLPWHKSCVLSSIIPPYGARSTVWEECTAGISWVSTTGVHGGGHKYSRGGVKIHSYVFFKTIEYATDVFKRCHLVHKRYNLFIF